MEMILRIWICFVILYSPIRWIFNVHIIGVQLDFLYQHLRYLCKNVQHLQPKDQQECAGTYNIYSADIRWAL